MDIFRLNRPFTTLTMLVTAIIGVLILVAPRADTVGMVFVGAPTLAAPRAGAAAPTAAGLAGSIAHEADPAALDIATQEHVSLAQAEVRLSWQQGVPALASALRSALPAATFGGIWIAPNDGDRVKVGVVGLNSGTRAAAAGAVRSVGLSAAADLVPVR